MSFRLIAIMRWIRSTTEMSSLVSTTVIIVIVTNSLPTNGRAYAYIVMSVDLSSVYRLYIESIAIHRIYVKRWVLPQICLKKQIGNGVREIEWSRDRWHRMSLKGQGHDRSVYGTHYRYLDSGRIHRLDGNGSIWRTLISQNVRSLR